MKRVFAHKRPSAKRRGATAVEFALAAPILFLFVFASVEFARANMIFNTIENAAYEGARRGVVPGATEPDCKAATQTLLDIVGIKNSTVTVDPTTINESTESVTVTVDVPMTVSNGYVASHFFLGKTLSVSITLPRESN